MESRYSVNQDGKEYILSTKLYEEKVKIECQDNNYNNCPNYSHDYTLEELHSVSKIFSMMNSLTEVQTKIENAIENQNVSIINKGEIIEVTFTIEINNHVAEITFQLPKNEIQYETSKFQKVNDDNNNNYYKYENYLPVQKDIETVVNEPIYKVENLPAYYQDIKNVNYQENNDTYSTNINKGRNVVYVQEAPDVTYSSGQAAPDVAYSSEGRQTQYFMGGCQCPLDHERINNLENTTNNLKNEHSDIKARINALKSKIEMLKKQSSIIKNENNVLNNKTLNLKQQYSQLIEAESAMRFENNSLRKENQGLLLKKKQLEFYLNEQHDHSYVKEVTVPLEVKKHRPTAVSKKDKTFLAATIPSYNYQKIDNTNGNLYQTANLQGSTYQQHGFSTNTYTGSRMPQLNNSRNFNMNSSMNSKKL